MRGSKTNSTVVLSTWASWERREEECSREETLQQQREAEETQEERNR